MADVTTTTCPPIANVGNVSFAYSGGTLTVSWTGSGNGYTVRYRDADIGSWTDSVQTAGTSINIGSLLTGKSYAFEFVSAYCGGTQFTLPDYYSYTVPSGASAPTAFAFDSDPTPTTVALKWTGPNTATYRIYYEGNDSSSGFKEVSDLSSTRTTIDNLDPEVFYKFRIARVEGDEQIYADNYLEKCPGC